MSLIARCERVCSRHGSLLLLLALCGFLASRVFVWSLLVPGDVPIFARYAYEARAAQLDGATIYEAFYRDDNRSRAIEYPPLAIELFALLGALVPAHTDLAGFTRSFSDTFHALVFVLDVVTLVVVVVYLLRQKTPRRAIVAAVATYTLAGLVLKDFLYSRSDVLLGQLLLLALVLMISRRPLTLVSCAVLSVAVAFKLVPVVLVPIWVVGALAEPSASGVSRTRELATKGAVVAGAVLLPWIGYAVRFGEDAIAFLGVHFARGIHIESSWGTATVLLSKAGLPVTVELFRSFDIASSLSASFEALAVVALAGGCAVIYWLYFSRAVAILSAQTPEGGTIAQRDPDLFRLATLATVVFNLAVSTVFSPQYILWLLPVGLLLPWGQRWGRISHPILLVLAFLTALIVPKFYTSDVLQLTWFGTTLLTLRNAGVVLYAGFLIACLARRRASEHVSA